MVKLLTEGEKKPWKPLVIRQGNDFIREANGRIQAMTERFASGDEGKVECGKLDLLGDLLSDALKLTGLNPTEFADLAKIDERKMFFASTGLLRPEEFLEDGFLTSVDEGFKKYFGVDVNSSGEAIRLLSSGERLFRL